MTADRLVICIMLVNRVMSHRGVLPRTTPRAQLVRIEDLGGQSGSNVFWPRFESPLARLYEAVNQARDSLERLVFPLLDVTLLILVLVLQRGRDSLIRRRRENKSRLSQFPTQITDLLCLPILGRFQRRVDRQQRAIRDFQVRDLWKRVSLSSLGRKGPVKRTLRLVFASALSCRSDPSDSASLSTPRGLLSLERLRSRFVWATISACGKNGLD